ncbi:MMPL family transporter [Isosphaeraceae bacterium EP7]
MSLERLRSIVTRRPGWVVSAWVVLALGVGLTSPNLTRLAAEGQAKLMAGDAESVRAAKIVDETWPAQSFDSLAALVIGRPGGLTEADRDFARKLAGRFDVKPRPAPILRVLGPGSEPELAERLVSRDGTMQLLAVTLATSLVAPASHETVAWLEAQSRAMPAPEGLALRWTGDAVIGRDYMAGVQASLDRAALATVVLLMGVLLVVYRSCWLALIPLATIGLSLLLTRGILAWLVVAGWEVSPLVELFLVAVLFGCGTDFCLFVSWRYADHWTPSNPAGAMRLTLRRGSLALLTSAGTVIIGQLLMGTTRFKLFSRTGPSVALGLMLTLAATLTLTPALLVLLAQKRPASFKGLIAAPSGFWHAFGRRAMARPGRNWALTLAFMLPLAAYGFMTHITYDMLAELPSGTRSVEVLKRVDEAFGPGLTAPLTVVLESVGDLRSSEGLALIDDVSRFLARQKQIAEVRSATQPLGRGEQLASARLGSRLDQVGDGLGRIAAGASQLRAGLDQGAGKLRAAIWLESKTGLKLTGSASTTDARTPKPAEEMLRELTRAAEGAGQIADGAKLGRDEIAGILDDPVGKRALDRLLIHQATVKAHPELLRAFGVYISRDGRRARIDLAQAAPLFSEAALDQVERLRRILNDFLADASGPATRATLAGPNAGSADIRSMTRADQWQSWILIPAGVFVVLLVALRDVMACLNLVATMLLTYAFALGATHAVFVGMLGSHGLDWKVPYFLFVLLVAVGVDYNVFLMARLQEEVETSGLRRGIIRAVAGTGGLISSAAAITACSFASFLTSPLESIRQLGFALVIGIAVDAMLVRPLLVPCGHWLMNSRKSPRRENGTQPAKARTELVMVGD